MSSKVKANSPVEQPIELEQLLKLQQKQLDSLGNSASESFDFERWATAVKHQMVTALQKRAEVRDALDKVS